MKNKSLILAAAVLFFSTYAIAMCWAPGSDHIDTVLVEKNRPSYADLGDLEFGQPMAIDTASGPGIFQFSELRNGNFDGYQMDVYQLSSAGFFDLGPRTIHYLLFPREEDDYGAWIDSIGDFRKGVWVNTPKGIAKIRAVFSNSIVLVLANNIYYVWYLAALKIVVAPTLLDQ